MRARLNAAPGLQPRDAHALAGLLDAEGCFQITPGRRFSHILSVAIQLRDDDADTLIALRRATGLGRLMRVPQRARSRPQVRWWIGSKLECLTLADLLDEHPLRGRKRSEARIWAAAVRVWAAKTYHAEGALHERLERARHRLAQHRVYRGFVAAGPVPRFRNRDALYGFFAGFFSGEGCLLLDPDRKRAQLIVKLRRDDLPLLRSFQHAFGVGRIIEGAGSGWHPTALWHVTARPQLRAVVEILDATPLLGRKARQYQAWRPAAVELGQAASARRQPNPDVLATARERLSAVSRYRPGLYELPRDDDSGDARRAHIETLRAWAETHEEALSCLAYEDARKARRGWPSRNTMATGFGSWRKALVAAGLADRSPRPIER